MLRLARQAYGEGPSRSRSGGLQHLYDPRSGGRHSLEPLIAVNMLCILGHDMQADSAGAPTRFTCDRQVLV